MDRSDRLAEAEEVVRAMIAGHDPVVVRMRRDLLRRNERLRAAATRVFARIHAGDFS